MTARRCHAFLIPAVMILAWAVSANAETGLTPSGLVSPSDVTTDELRRVLLLQDYNTRVVALGTMMLGLAGGVVGTFMLLRKRALVGDAVSHATLPGIALAFMWMSMRGGDGKWLPGLLAGAAASGVVGVCAVLLIRRTTRIKEDAALGLVLSVFFGLGVALLGVIQTMTQGNQAGLESFIYGKTASMLASDAMMIGVIAIVSCVMCAALFKEFTLLCFDHGYASSQGWPATTLDVAMMSLVVVVTVIGLQAVGLILMIAMLIIPPASARFWTNRLSAMLMVSAVIGGGSGLVGAALSSLVPRLPAGAVIVVVGGVAFALSMIFGRRRGLIVRAIEHIRVERRVGRQNLMRGMLEASESDAAAREGKAVGVGFERLLAMRSWSRLRLRGLLMSAKRAGLVFSVDGTHFHLTELGRADAQRVVRNHRLWELYMITHADVAPGNVDRSADLIEHVLGEALVQRLEAMSVGDKRDAMPVSPHPIITAGGGRR